MWFRQKRSRQPDRAPVSEPAWLEQIARPVAHAGTKLHKAFAGCMGRVAGQLSPKGLKTALVAFSLWGGGLSGYWIISPITPGDETPSALPIESLHIPQQVGRDRTDRLLPNGAPDGRVLHRIRAFRRYMDSLQTAAPRLYDSIHKGRQGLLDSLQRVEKMFPLQP